MAKHGHHDERSRKAGYGIRGLLHCKGKGCGASLDRDFSAALNIRKIFREQTAARSLDLHLAVTGLPVHTA